MEMQLMHTIEKTLLLKQNLVHYNTRTMAA